MSPVFSIMCIVIINKVLISTVIISIVIVSPKWPGFKQLSDQCIFSSLHMHWQIETFLIFCGSILLLDLGPPQSFFKWHLHRRENRRYLLPLAMVFEKTGIMSIEIKLLSEIAYHHRLCQCAFKTHWDKCIFCLGKNKILTWIFHFYLGTFSCHS